MTTIEVHQSLHGYNDGHRLISSSFQLDSSDARTMLVMSDLSGSGVKPPVNGYLTGYALENSGRYVLARTWAAPEMPRPGCVWTHSLIIENADLARMMSARDLLDVFIRPTDISAQPSCYRSPVHVSAQTSASGIERTPRVELLLQALYSFPTQQVVIEASEPFDDERIVTAIWMQQWPRLRRSFGFCTLAGMDRSGKGVALDLQFGRENDSQLRSRFPGSVVADQAELSQSLRPLLSDLVKPASSTLREFLRRIGGDVDGGRRAMMPLCELYVSLLERNPPDLVAAVGSLAALDGKGRRQARSVRSLVARQAIKAPGRIEDVLFEFLVDMLDRSSDQAEQAEISEKLGMELWRRSPLRFHSALLATGPISDAAAGALKKMESMQIVSGLHNNGGIAVDIAGRRPDILKHTDFWRISEVGDELAERISDHDVDHAARALLAAGRIGPAASIICRADPAALITALESDEADAAATLGWLKVLSRDGNKTASLLSTGRVTKIGTIVVIARYMLPDDVPNAYGEDPWVIALRSASGTLETSEADFLAAFLLTRALGHQSRSQAELLRYSYSRVHTAFEERRFSDQTERLASWRLEWSLWFAWDNCSRLRDTVAKRFIEHDLEPEIFGSLVDDISLEASLIDEAARSEAGRKYLGRVLDALDKAEGDQLKERADYIAQKLSKDSGRAS